MHSAVRQQPSVWPIMAKISLSDIARQIDVPVVIVTSSDARAVRTHSTFGLDLGMNWSAFASAVDDQCIKGASIIPNIEVNQKLSQWSVLLVKQNIRFLVGIPLCDTDGWRVGSISVLANQKAVARKGIAIRQLGELGRQFVGLPL
jgi:hypothetical protein